MYLFATCIFSLLRCMSRYFTHFFSWALCFFTLKGLLYFRNKLLFSMFCKYSLPVCGLSFHSLNIVSYRTEVLNFSEVQFITFVIHGLCSDTV